MNLLYYAFLFLVTLWLGNFLTSFYFRIPRNIPLNGKTNPPMCSTCGVKLKYPDYGPLYYRIFRGKFCKVCNASIPSEYFFIELFTGVIGLLVFILYGITEKSCFMVFVVISSILVFLINLKHEKIPEKALWIQFVSSVVYVVYSLKYEPSIMYIIITNVAIGFVFAMILEKIILKKDLPEGYKPMFALISLLHLKEISLGIFLIILIMIIFFRKINIKYFMSFAIVMSTIVLISNISFPYLEI